MTIVGRAARAMHVACISLLAVACAGPVPTGSPGPSVEPTEFAVASPTAEPSPTVEPTFTFAPSPTVPLETPVAYPSYEPDPTPEGALPLRTAVEINPNIVERPGWPPELHDRYWWTPDGDAGLLGTTAQIGLPARELIITVAEGLVVSAREYGADGTILVRDFATGELLRQIRTGVTWPQAVVVGGRLFWTGLTGEGTDQVLDGGVWSTNARTRELPSEIVAPGRALGAALCGRNLKVSPSGETIAATASCFGWKGWTDVIDVGSQAQLRRLKDVAAWALTDATFVAPDAVPSDGLTYGQGGVTAYDISTGLAKWQYPDASNVDIFSLNNVVALGNAFVVNSTWDVNGPGIETRFTIFNPASGTHRLLLRDAPSGNGFYLDPNSSTPDYVVLGEYEPGLQISGTPISIVRVSDGALLRDAFVIDPPFLCFIDWCFRD